MKAKDRVKQILKDCCAGNASLATDILHEEFVIIHRDELPDAKVIERTGLEPVVDCGSDWGTWKVQNVDRMRTVALDYVAAWVTAEAWHKEQASKDAARDKRRDEIMGELNSQFTYKELGGNPFAKAVDRIIDLELAACE